MGLFDFLTGRQDGTATTTTELPDYIKKYGRQNLQIAEGIANRPYPVYGGERVAGLSPLELQARQNAVAGNERWGQYYGRATDMTERAASPLDLSQYQNPYTQQVVDAVSGDIQRAGNQQQAQNALRFSAGGAFGGARHGVAQSLTDEATQRNIGQATAQLRHQGFGTALGAAQADRNSALDTASSFAGLGSNAARLGQQDIGLLNNLGTADRAIGQSINDTRYGDFMAQFNYPQQALNIRQGALSGTPHGQSTVQPTYSNPFMSALGGLATVAGAGNSFGWWG
jgi:hypothetical protein